MTNKEVAQRLDSMTLNQKARNIVEQTAYNNLAEMFGDLDTEDKVEAFVEEYFEEDKYEKNH